MKKKIAILGSTGSIGQQTLEIAHHLQDKIEVVAISAHSNIDLLEQQYHAYAPKCIACWDQKSAEQLKKRIPQANILSGDEGINAIATFDEAELIVSAISGTKGLLPTYQALKAKKDIALANKEALVSGGALITQLAKKNGCKILPVDSEHSAIFQCLQGEKETQVERVILTASGGPFRTYSKEALQKVTSKQALKHPNWSMGPKVTIDSSTLMNKGLELIEAYWLFNLSIEQIDVVIHPQSIIHSFVEFIDGSTIAQLGKPSMLTPIQYALTYPERMQGKLNKLDIVKTSPLTFEEPDLERFKALKLAKEALRSGGTTPAFMNGANEALVYQFLEGKISWPQIADRLESLLTHYKKEPIVSIEHLIEVDREAREVANN